MLGDWGRACGELLMELGDTVPNELLFGLVVAVQAGKRLQHVLNLALKTPGQLLQVRLLGCGLQVFELLANGLDPIRGNRSGAARGRGLLRPLNFLVQVSL